MLASGLIYFLETHLTWTSITLSCALVCFLSVSYVFWSLVHIPYDQGIPVVGIPNGLLGRARAVYDSIAHGDIPIASGYKIYNKLGQIFRVPSLMDSFSFVYVIPSPLIPQYNAAPEERVSFVSGLEHLDLTPYTLLEHRFTQSPTHLGALRSTLSGGKEVEILADEVATSFTTSWKFPTEWTTIPNLYYSLLDIITRDVNRAYVGSKFCRDKDYIETIIGFTPEVVRCRTILRMIPGVLRPIVSPYVLRHNKARRNKVHAILGEEIERRKSSIGSKADSNTPTDLLQALITEASKSPQSQAELDPKMLVTRLLALNFVGNRTASVAFTHAIWSLLHCESRGLGYWDDMRDEIEKIYASDDSAEATLSKKQYMDQGATWMRWNKTHTAQMSLVESFLKESLRYNTDTNLECKRMIVDPAGYRFKNGVNLKPGTVTAVPIWQIHHDEDIYPQPEDFDARRFYQEDNGMQARKVSMQTTSEYFLAFGQGKHACPGRFFASQHLKLLMAFILLNYEIQPMSRPDDEWYGSSHMPNMAAGLTIRARQY